MDSHHKRRSRPDALALHGVCEYIELEPSVEERSCDLLYYTFEFVRGRHFWPYSTLFHNDSVRKIPYKAS